MSPPVYLTRADWGADPVVRSSSGSPRPALAKPARWITVHYTGNSSPLTTADRAAVIAAQQLLERFAAGEDKPNEYNWCLYSDAAGQGYVVEYAGAYQAAHSSGENDKAVGVLFWIGVNQSVPAAMVTAYQWLRDAKLYPSGLAVSGSTSQTPHSSMPGAATPCPGPVMYRWDELLAPYDSPDQELPMTYALVRHGLPDDSAWNAYKVNPAGKYWLPTHEALARAVDDFGYHPIIVDDAYMEATGPVQGPNPTTDPWGKYTAVSPPAVTRVQLTLPNG